MSINTHQSIAADELTGRIGWHRESHYTTTEIASAEGNAITLATGADVTKDQLVILPLLGEPVMFYTTANLLIEGTWLGLAHGTAYAEQDNSILVMVLRKDTSEIAELRVAVEALDYTLCRAGSMAPAEVLPVLKELRRQSDEHAARIDEIVSSAQEEADNRDWCDEFDDFMESMGLPRRVRDYELEVRVSATVWMTVEAGSRGEAEQEATSDAVLERMTSGDLDIEAIY